MRRHWDAAACYQRAGMLNKALECVLGENYVTGISPKTDTWSKKKRGSSEWTEVFQKGNPGSAALLGIPPKKSWVSVKIESRDHFVPKTTSVQVVESAKITLNFYQLNCYKLHIGQVALFSVYFLMAKLKVLETFTRILQYLRIACVCLQVVKTTIVLQLWKCDVINLYVFI